MELALGPPGVAYGSHRSRTDGSGAGVQQPDPYSQSAGLRSPSPSILTRRESCFNEFAPAMRFRSF
jgi:hypothetical protein